MSIRDRLPPPDEWWLFILIFVPLAIIAVGLLLLAANHDNNTPAQDNDNKTMICMWTYVGKVPVCNPIYL